MIQYLISGIFFFENIFSDIQLSYIRPHVPVDIIWVCLFLFHDFVAESLKANKNWRKSFAQKTSLILQTSIHLTLKIISSRNTAKNLSDFTIFQQTCFRLVPEKTFALHHFLTPKNYILEVLWNQMYISVRKFLFQRRSKILSSVCVCVGGGSGLGRGWIISLRQLAVWAS